jgi:hypothetical protein
MTQIEEKKKKQDAEKKKKLEEDEKEEMRVKKEMEELNKKYKAELNPQASNESNPNHAGAGQSGETGPASDPRRQRLLRSATAAQRPKIGKEPSEEVPNKDASKQVSPVGDNRHHQQTLGLKEIVRAIKITDTIKRTAGRGMKMGAHGISSSRMTEGAARASISIKIMGVSSTIMKEVRTIKEAPHR